MAQRPRGPQWFRLMCQRLEQQSLLDRLDVTYLVATPVVGYHTPFDISSHPLGGP